MFFHIPISARVPFLESVLPKINAARPGGPGSRGFVLKVVPLDIVVPSGPFSGTPKLSPFMAANAPLLKAISLVLLL